MIVFMFTLLGDLHAAQLGSRSDEVDAGGNYSALCVVARNENLYIREFVQYHLCLGVCPPHPHVPPLTPMCPPLIPHVPPLTPHVVPLYIPLSSSLPPLSTCVAMCVYRTLHGSLKVCG